MHALPHSVPLTLQQAITNARLCQRLVDIHRQVGVSLLCGYCSFLLGPGAHGFVPCFHSNPKERQWQRIFKLLHNCTHLISHTSKVMLKILQARLQQYMKWELPDVQAGFRKGRGTRDQIANIHWMIEKAREFQKNIYFCFIDDAKAFDCVDHHKMWKALKEMGVPYHLTCLLKNLYAGQEAN